MIRRIRNFLCAIACVAFCGMCGAYAAQPSQSCVQMLASELADNILKIDLENDTVVISSDMVIDFFTKNIDVCRDYLLARTSDEDVDIAEAGLIMELHWDYIVQEVAAKLTVGGNERVMFMCENDRSYMGAIDIVMWAATIVAAVYSFGSGSVVVQGGKAAVVQGAKSLVKTGSIQGMKKAVINATAKRVGADIAGKTAAVTAAEAAANAAGKTTATAAAEAAAKQAAKDAATKVANNAVIIQAKNDLRAAGAKRVTDAAIKNHIQSTLMPGATTAARRAELTDALNLLSDKSAKNAAKKAAVQASKDEIAAASADLAAAQATLTAEQALATNALKTALTKFAVSTPIAALGAWGIAYGFLSDDLNTEVMNCTGLDRGENCYITCSESLTAPNDDMNTKVFKPLLGKNLCIDEETYVLREIQSQGLPMPGAPFITTQEKWEQIKSKINSTVKDTGNCDWNEDDIDMYVAVPMYNADTLTPEKDGAYGLIIDVQRIDD